MDNKYYKPNCFPVLQPQEQQASCIMNEFSAAFTDLISVCY